MSSTTPDKSQVPESSDDRPTGRSFLPALNFVIVLLMGNFLAALVIREGIGPGGTPIVVNIIGFILGQFAFYTLLGGLLGDSWLDGLCLSWILCLFASAMIWVGVGAHFDDSVALFLHSIPAACFVACAPLLFCRWLIGWQLRPESIEPLPRIRLSIEDLILVPACIFSLFAFARVPLLNQVDMYGIIDYGFTSSIGLVFSAICLLFVIPMTFFALRSTNEFRWVVIWLMPPFFVTMILLVASIFVTIPFGSVPTEAPIAVIGTTLIASSIGTLGLYLLWFGGYRLASRATKARDTTVPDASEPQRQNTQVTELRIRHRVYVLTIFFVTAISNIIASQNAMKSTAQTLTAIEAQGGKLVRENGRVVGIHFGRKVAPIPDASPCAGIRSITFSETQLDDQIMDWLRIFPSLESIDVSRAEVDAILLMRYKSEYKFIVREGQFSDAELTRFGLSGVVKVE